MRAGIQALLVMLRALRLGAAYGVRIRMPHAMVMNVLFGKDKTVSGILRRVLSITWEHGRNLASFAVLYKAVLLALRGAHTAVGLEPATSAVGRPAAPWHALLAGAAGAYAVWTPQSSVNLQILFYLLSRALFGVFRLLAQRGVQPFASLSFDQVYPSLSVAVWAVVMWLFENHPDSLHPSLTASMNEIYRDANILPPALNDYLPTAGTVVVIAYALYAGLPLLPGPAAVASTASRAAGQANAAVGALRRQLNRFPALSPT